MYLDRVFFYCLDRYIMHFNVKKNFKPKVKMNKLKPYRTRFAGKNVVFDSE